MRITASAAVRVMLAFAGVAAFGCATSTPYQEPIRTEPLAISDTESLGLDRIIVLFDASGSIHPKQVFPGEKAWVESFVQGMPDGTYDAKIESFGGDKRRGAGLSGFDRGQLAAAANDIQYIGEGTPLEDVLAATAVDIDGVDGRTAIVLVSDGVSDDPEWGDSKEPVIDAARKVAEGSKGGVCYHTVLAGNDSAGRARLQKLAAVTDCGSFRSSGSLADANGLESFQREMFVAKTVPAPAIVAAASAGSGDSDQDGVLNGVDECASTPTGASVDERGCWVLENVRFASNSDEIVGNDLEGITDVAQVLNANPDLKVQISGYTDSTGSAAYNRTLSKRRAERVEGLLKESGIDGARLESAGYGEENPVADNATAEGRSENRRIEISVIQ